jgi:CRP/FNR family transcriptional regulator, cyclic AMP receptor protein
VALFTEDTKVEALWGCPFFAGLHRRELAEVAKVTEDLEVDEGKVLTREGESGREFFVIIEGEVSVEREGREIRRLAGGDFFGEIALLEDRPRTATVVARTPLRFFVLTRQSFKSLVDRQPEIEQKVRAAIEERLGRPDDPV